MFFLHAEFELFVCNYVSDYENKAFKKLDKGLKKNATIKIFLREGNWLPHLIMSWFRI